MFNYSFSEIALVALVALIAIGPERLPRVARGAGILFGRFRRYAETVKSEIDQEIQKAQLKDVQEKIKEAQQQVQTAMAQSQSQTEQFLNTPVNEEVENKILTPLVEEVKEPLPVSVPIIGIVGVAGDPFSARAKTLTRSQPIKSSQISLSLDESSSSGAL